MTTATRSIDALRQTRPEWTPWLAIVDRVLREANDARWQSVAIETRTSEPGTPLLAGARIFVRPELIAALLEDVLRTAARSNVSALTSLGNVRAHELDGVRLLAGSLNYDSDSAHSVATRYGSDGSALAAVVHLLPVPLLMTHAGRSRVSDSWIEPFCPHCGSWPAFTEVRGIERRRFNRCGRCGSQWQAQHLRCPFCRTSNHEELAALVPADTASASTVEACQRCRGYVKALTRLQGCAPDNVMLDDLASVDLDVAAMEHDYSRPTHTGYALDVSVSATS